MSKSVLHCLRQLMMPENQYENFSTGELVAGRFLGLNEVMEGLVSAVQSISPLSESL
jgi:hypothetical protein